MLKGKTAIVTGASGRGMGRSIALTLARERANVVANYLTSSDSAANISEYIEKQGGQSLTYKADVTQRDQCKALVDATIEKFGQVDICVIGPGGGWHPETIEKLNSQAALDDVHKELAPIYNFMPLVLSGMYSRRWGRIIAISLLSSVPSPSYAYNSGKAARTNALLLAHKEAWTHGVTINVIAPGPVKELASLTDAIELCDHGPKWQDRKNITPQDIAEGVCMLCSDFGKFISGCELPYMFY